MRDRFIEYFRQNYKWIFTFLVFMILDSLWTILLLNKAGIDTNPFSGTKEFDWSLHFWRIDTAIVLIPLIALTNWGFARKWIIQGITVGYGWSVVNGLSDLLFGVDIGIYQFIPQWMYFFGVLFQFAVGLIILWVYRNIRGKEKVR